MIQVKKAGIFLSIIATLLTSSVTGQVIDNPTFNGLEGDYISMKDASSWIARFNRSGLTKSDTGSYFYSRELLLQLLNMPGSVGVRFEFGLSQTQSNNVLLDKQFERMTPVLIARSIDAQMHGINLNAQQIRGQLGTSNTFPFYGIPGSSTSNSQINIFSNSVLTSSNDASSYVDLKTANSWIANFTSSNPFKHEMRSLFYGEQIIRELLDGLYVVGLRVHFGLKENNEPVLVLAPVKKFQSDELLNNALSGFIDSEQVTSVPLVDNGKKCPPFCD